MSHFSLLLYEELKVQSLRKLVRVSVLPEKGLNLVSSGARGSLENDALLGGWSCPFIETMEWFTVHNS
jgi:hypothetical protein